MKGLILEKESNLVYFIQDGSALNFKEGDTFLLNGYETSYSSLNMKVLDAEVDVPENFEPAMFYFDAESNSLKISQSQVEIKIHYTRIERDKKLSSCDWTQTLDAPLSDEKKLEWASYRKALRDLPSTLVDGIGEVVWPSKPE